MSFNKRTHASTLYKAVIAKQRLEQLENQTQQASLCPTKRMRSDSNISQVPAFSAKVSNPSSNQLVLSSSSVSPVDFTSMSQSLQLRHSTSDAHMQENEHSLTIRVHESGSSQAQQPQVSKPCNCRKSRCLKLYCECFANNRFCGPQCACCGCHNGSAYDSIRLQAKQQILMRNPHAFRQSRVVEAQELPQETLVRAVSVTESVESK